MHGGRARRAPDEAAYAAARKELGTIVLSQAARLARSQRAVTSLEYGLIGALVFLVIVVGVTGVGSSLLQPFTTVAAALH